MVSSRVQLMFVFGVLGGRGREWWWGVWAERVEAVGLLPICGFE